MILTLLSTIYSLALSLFQSPSLLLEGLWNKATADENLCRTALNGAALTANRQTNGPANRVVCRTS